MIEKNIKERPPVVAVMGHIDHGKSQLLDYIRQSNVVDKEGKQALPGEGRLRSGVCGAAIQWAGLGMTHRIAKLREELDRKFMIIGVGGVTVASDYQKYTEAGADVVMSATGAMWNPNLAIEIKNTLKSN